MSLADELVKATLSRGYTRLADGVNRIADAVANPSAQGLWDAVVAFEEDDWLQDEGNQKALGVLLADQGLYLVDVTRSEDARQLLFHVTWGDDIEWKKGKRDKLERQQALKQRKPARLHRDPTDPAYQDYLGLKNKAHKKLDKSSAEYQAIKASPEFALFQRERQDFLEEKRRLKASPEYLEFKRQRDAHLEEKHRLLTSPEYQEFKTEREERRIQERNARNASEVDRYLTHREHYRRKHGLAQRPEYPPFPAVLPLELIRLPTAVPVVVERTVVAEQGHFITDLAPKPGRIVEVRTSKRPTEAEQAAAQQQKAQKAEQEARALAEAEAAKAAQAKAQAEAEERACVLAEEQAEAARVAQRKVEEQRAAEAAALAQKTAAAQAEKAAKAAAIAEREAALDQDFAERSRRNAQRNAAIDAGASNAFLPAPQTGPHAVDLSNSERLICRCGQSAHYPFCDETCKKWNATKGTSFQPWRASAEQIGADVIYVCGCGESSAFANAGKKGAAGLNLCDGECNNLEVNKKLGIRHEIPVATRTAQEAAMKREQERLTKDAQDKAAKEAQERAARDAQERAVKEAQERAAQEKAAQEKAAQEKAVREAQERAARELKATPPLPVRFFDRAKARGDAPAFQFIQSATWTTVSWSEFHGQVKTFARALIASKVLKGDRVLLLSDTRADWASLFIAIQSVGAIVVSVPPTFGSEQLQEVVFQTSPVMVITDERAQFDKFLEHRLIDSAKTVRQYVCIRSDLATAKNLSWNAFVELGKDETLTRDLDKRLSELTLKDVGTVHYVDNRVVASHPKLRGSRLTLGNEAFAADTYTSALKVTEADRILVFMPYADAACRATSLFQSVNTGCVLFYGEELEKLHQNLSHVQPTIIYSAPILWERFEAVIRVKLGTALPDVLSAGVKEKLRTFIGCRNARFAFSATTAVHPSTVAFYWALGLPLRNLYAKGALTGVCSVDLSTPPHQGTCGAPLPGIQVRVTNGALEVSGGNVCDGYWTAPGRAGDWFATGDEGNVNSSGDIVVAGSQGNRIVLKNGFVVHPERLEVELKVNPLISNAMVFGNGQEHVAALIAIERDLLVSLAKKRNVSVDEMAASPETLAQIDQQVNDLNKRLPAEARIRRYKVIPREFSVLSSEVTPSMLLCRSVIGARYRELIEGCF